jgi:hypothetical protein
MLGNVESATKTITNTAAIITHSAVSAPCVSLQNRFNSSIGFMLITSQVNGLFNVYEFPRPLVVRGEADICRISEVK